MAYRRSSIFVSGMKSPALLIDCLKHGALLEEPFQGQETVRILCFLKIGALSLFKTQNTNLQGSVSQNSWRKFFRTS